MSDAHKPGAAPGTAGGADEQNSAARAWVEDNALPVLLFAALALGLAVLALAAATLPGFRVAPALLWALGFCAAGLLLGFIFAIPRVPPTVARTEPEGPASAASPAAAGAPAGAAPPAALPPRVPEVTPSEINSNLVEVSDWLTKIIVGVGLVQLKELPEDAESLARFVAASLGMVQSNGVALASGVSVAGATMLYFSVLGFLGGYLLTRVYLAAIFKFIETAIYQPSPRVRLASGRTLPVEELTRLQQSALEDMQRTLTRIAAPIGTADEARELGRASEKRVLWVDDYPDNNTLLIEQLNSMGITVDAVLSTDEAMARLRGPVHYAAVVSDMGRSEAGQHVADAGVRLLQSIKSLHPDMPVLVYCSAQALAAFGQAARDAGADLCTSSGTSLLFELRKRLM